MKRTSETPTVTPNSDDRGTKKTHPAYGMLRFSRTSGNSGKLFGSEINHQSFIRLSLQPGEENWNLSQSWLFGQSKCLFEIDMSAAQFAELISSLNMGSGVPCTIRYLNGIGQLPEIEDPETFHQQIKADLRKEASDAFADAKKLIQSLKDVLAKSTLSKAKQAELLDIANRLKNAVDGSMPFILDQYQEGAEKIAAKAKAELDAFTQHVVSSLGMKALAELNAAPPEQSVSEIEGAET